MGEQAKGWRERLSQRSAVAACAAAMPFDDETIAKLEKKLIGAGYTDGEWRSIMFKYYGEDYEGMATRARQRANERELRKLTMDITQETSVLPYKGASDLDPAAVGGTQAMVERGLADSPKPQNPEKLFEFKCNEEVVYVSMIVS